MFMPPDGYQCLTRSGDTITAYKTYQRDTYVINGFEWEKTQQSNYSSAITMPSWCLSKDFAQYPTGFTNNLITPAVLLCIAFFVGVWKIFGVVRGRK